MATQKRRVVYLSDEEWANVKERAGLRGISASAYIRAVLGGGFIIPESVLRAEAAKFARPAPKSGPGTR